MGKQDEHVRKSTLWTSSWAFHSNAEVIYIIKRFSNVVIFERRYHHHLHVSIQSTTLLNAGAAANAVFCALQSLVWHQADPGQRSI